MIAKLSGKIKRNTPWKWHVFCLIGYTEMYVLILKVWFISKSIHCVSCLLCFRTAHAQGKAEAAVGAAQKAQEESRMARVTAKQFSPSFQHPGNGEYTHTHTLNKITSHSFSCLQHMSISMCIDISTNSAKQMYNTFVCTCMNKRNTCTYVCVCVGDKGQSQPPSSFAFLPLSLTPVKHCR